MISDGVKSL